MAQARNSPSLDAWRHLSLAVAQFQRSAASRLGVQPADLDCLELLRSGESVIPTTLGRLTGYTPGAVTGVIDRLVRAGFARRVRDPEDGRRVTVEPVIDAIEAALSPVSALLTTALAGVHGDYSEADIALVVGYLERSAAAIEEVAKG